MLFPSGIKMFGRAGRRQAEMITRNFMGRFANIHNLTELGALNIPRANGCCYTGKTDHMVEREL
jgi:hypothetical protein